MPVGGQGYLLGRNHGISGRVVKRIGKENVIIVRDARQTAELRGVRCWWTRAMPRPTPCSPAFTG